MPKPARKIRLRRGDRATLEQWLRSRTTSQRLVERARIVLASAKGIPAHRMSDEAGISRPTIQRWLDRYEADGLSGIAEDRPRPGRPRRITPEVQAEVVRRTLQEKPPEGTHWSTRLMAAETGIHHSQIARIWRAHGIKPHRVKYFKLSTDPNFVEKLRDVVGLYVAPLERAIVFSFDEKSQIEALDRTQPGLPLKKGRAGTSTFDYKRHGTTTLFAALDVASGEVIHHCLPRHQHQEFLRFIRKVERESNPALDLHFILDNYATQKHPKVQAWLARNPRVHFHFLPTSASWLTLVERFFRELSQGQLKRLAVSSAEGLVDAITAYIDHRNHNPRPFVWTASVSDILAKVQKGNRTLEALH